MKLVIQRVKSAAVKVNGEVISSIDNGLLVLLGIAHTDNSSPIPYLAKKLVEMRIFSDSAGKMNLSVKDIGGSILLVSQFTLCADLSRGRRPDFFTAAPPEKAIPLYEQLINELSLSGIPIQTGIFGAEMDVSLINDGPVTFILEK